MSKYEKVTISMAVATAEDQLYIVKFFKIRLNDFDFARAVKTITESKPQWCDVSGGKDGHWSSQDKVWKLNAHSSPGAHYINTSLVTDIHVEEVDIDD